MQPCQGHLTTLALASEGLACAFPEALAALTALTTLDLTFNRLEGRMEREVALVRHALPALESLQLGYNRLEGAGRSTD